MEQLFAFIAQSRNFILFVLLEVLCFYFIINTNNYWSASFFNTSNRYAAQMLAWSNTAHEYTNLRQVNSDLAAENLRLRTQLTARQQERSLLSPPLYKADSIFATRFEFTVGKVINNTTTLANNYLTIDKGTADGVKPGMGVISPTGVVGRVRFCNEHFSVITSILHSEFRVSARLVRSNEIGTARWMGSDPTRMDLLDISRYKPVSKGDSVVTSDQNSVFPPGILIGRVRSIGVQANQTFHDLTIDLSTNFGNLSYVYIVQNNLAAEQSQLEKQVENEK
ncbi:rod shape-determining protein MreC [Fibrivirga algicola]|uniref:Cell shape-determining protein MreC n=1 Tax=Fibrivirga algicola TaxID=2950420 RepID=A0ABX0QGE6_9BACT|nr:rod shape-determining protein MreC [Fibrivirga algicola]ARK10041.1 rod shape-determining protein MreC [Fibrella sp. ES10-3-2-2]NID11500.1 rod shape-determining protein MreC [Fibrivirga algicola]